MSCGVTAEMARFPGSRNPVSVLASRRRVDVVDSVRSSRTDAVDLRFRVRTWMKLRRRALLCCAILAGIGALPVCADARPGTPTDVRAEARGHRFIQFRFRNTASEAVVFDIEMTKNGATVDPVGPQQTRYGTHALVNCGIRAGFGRAPTPTDCEHLFWSWPGTVNRGQPIERNGQILLLRGDVFDPDATYCLRVRARDWNRGEPDKGDVSDLWSAWACATTASLPPSSSA